MNLFYGLPHDVQGMVLSHILHQFKIHRQPLLDAKPFYRRYICKAATPLMLTIVHNARLTHGEVITSYYNRPRVFYYTEVDLNLELLFNIHWQPKP